jgi:hypothetical protein
MARRVFSWFAFEAQALAVSVAVGAVAAFIAELAVTGIKKVDWGDWIGLSIRCSIVLFLWSSSVVYLG